jgi:spoIIIJ-associated protein
MEKSMVENDARSSETRQADVALGVVQDILAGCGAEADVSYTQDDTEIAIDVSGDNLGQIIGRRAQTLDSIQLLAYLISSKAVGPDERRRVTVDVDEYRAAREEELLEVADEAAREALDSGVSIELAPMSANERRVVHRRLADNEAVETESTGEGIGRRVVVIPVD